MIEQRGEMIVANLHQLSVLSPSETFCMVTLERLRFVLKEKEKELDDTEESSWSINLSLFLCGGTRVLSRCCRCNNRGGIQTDCMFVYSD